MKTETATTPTTPTTATTTTATTPTTAKKDALQSRMTELRANLKAKKN